MAAVGFVAPEVIPERNQRIEAHQERQKTTLSGLVSAQVESPTGCQLRHGGFFPCALFFVPWSVADFSQLAKEQPP